MGLLTTRVERAVRAYLIGQGVGSPEQSFISFQSKNRTARSRTFIVRAMMSKNGVRPQGAFHLEIQHVWDAFEPTDNPGPSPASQFEEMVSETIRAMFAQADGQSPMPEVGDAITLAGRALAVNPGFNATPEAQKLFADNTDMAYFRADYVLAHPTWITRGETETIRGEFFWCEILNFVIQASNSNLTLPN